MRDCPKDLRPQHEQVCVPEVGIGSRWLLTLIKGIFEITVEHEKGPSHRKAGADTLEYASD